jgi:ribosomal protein S6E (S10)
MKSCCCSIRWPSGKPILSDAGWRTVQYVWVSLLLASWSPLGLNADPGALDAPIVRVVDLDIGETQQVELANGERVQVKLISVDEQRDSIVKAVRRAQVTVSVDGTEVELVSATYHLPITVGGVQIDCSITGGYNSNGRPSSWGLDKDARLRLWPAGSPLIQPETFGYPAKQKWFATMTQMANVPTYVDGGEDPQRTNIYYHSGLDIGGTEGKVEVVAATDGLVVSAGGDVLSGHKDDTPVAPRYDVVYLRDQRGWYYRYSHLKEIDPEIKPGRLISRGSRIGLLGKEGGSGGWTHLHFEIKSRQPSGKWGTQAGYAFLWQAYQQQYQPRIVAVARPHHFLLTGEDVVLDASKSWAAAEGALKYEWLLSDGTVELGDKIDRTYREAGSYSEIVKVTDVQGNTSYDFAIVQVVDSKETDRKPPTVHPTYYPTTGIRPGDRVTFTVRSFRTKVPKERWDFGDGSEPVEVQSDGNAEMHNPNGYAVTTHAFAKSGDYIVRVESTNEHDLKAVGHLHVHVDGPL